VQRAGDVYGLRFDRVEVTHDEVLNPDEFAAAWTQDDRPEVRS
jgi:hypothetical protein